MTHSRSLMALAAGLALCAGATAQVVITHAKALAGNVTPGDAPGYPVTISQPGSFVLKGHLVVPAGSQGIDIGAGAVGTWLDLNGFTIDGGGSCVRDNTGTVSCSGGSSTGIASQARDTVIRNGTVRGFSTGVFAYSGLLERLEIRENGIRGAIGGDAEGHLRVLDTVFRLNGGSGLICDYHCAVFRSTAIENGGDGYDGGSSTYSRAADSSALRNKGVGFRSMSLHGTQAALNKGGDTSSIISAGGNVAGGVAY